MIRNSPKSSMRIYKDLTPRSANLLNRLIKFSLASKELEPDCGPILIYNLFNGRYNFSYDNYKEILTYLSKQNLIFK